VAVDTPDNLTARLQGSQTLYLQVDTQGADPVPALEGLAGVLSVTLADRRDDVTGYLVESSSGDDIRRELSQTVVTNGWGLLELRPQQMSLEDIFLQLTTEDEPTDAQPDDATGNDDAQVATTEERTDG